MAVTVPDLSSEPLAKEFDELFHAHYQMVYRTVYRITGCTEEAEDVLQTVFLRVLRRGLPDFRKTRKDTFIARR
jgi:RNA polymerase sigma-70 factor, ECF subfamily